MKVKVLLVDDEQEFTEVLAERLIARGFDVRTAFTGDSAIETLKEHPVDVVVLDVLMPGKDGIATLTEIKQSNPLVEVIMLTGHATIETAISGLKLNAYDYLMKPTDTEALVTKITNAFRRKASQEERIRLAEVEKIVTRKGW